MEIRFSQKITGERKLVMLQVCEAMDTEPMRYLGPPTFAYQAGGWTIDRNGVLTSPFFEDEHDLCWSMAKVADGGFTAEGQLSVVLRSDNMEEESCREKMEAMLLGKASLIRKALGTESDMSVRITEGGEQVDIFPATLDQNELLAAVQFLICVHTQALAQKKVRAQDRPVENEKYAFRCFLLRIGMIGPQFANARRILLRNLEGNGSFKSGSRRPRPVVAEVVEDCPAVVELVEDTCEDKVLPAAASGVEPVAQSEDEAENEDKPAVA